MFERHHYSLGRYRMVEERTAQAVEHPLCQGRQAAPATGGFHVRAYAMREQGMSVVDKGRG